MISPYSCLLFAFNCQKIDSLSVLWKIVANFISQKEELSETQTKHKIQRQSAINHIFDELSVVFFELDVLFVFPFSRHHSIFLVQIYFSCYFCFSCYLERFVFVQLVASVRYVCRVIAIAYHRNLFSLNLWEMTTSYIRTLPDYFIITFSVCFHEMFIKIRREAW